jgi:hypothetical protein
MKKILLTLLTIVVAFNAFSQSLPPIDGLKLVTKEDFRSADSLALKVANYILSTPSAKNNVPRLKATQFLLNWMEGTPDFTFSLDEKAIKYFEKDMDLMGVYTASLTAYSIQNKQVTDTKIVTLNAVKIFITYIDNNGNNVTWTSKLKKLSEANQKGELESLLKL